VRSAYNESPEGVRVTVRVTPGASTNSIPGECEGVLQVKVTAPPEDGKANAAVVKLLAKHWGVAPTTVDVLTGTTSRNKTLLVRGYKLEELARR
jgi:uncharacterized protein (TIGR00251 family)